MTLADDLTRLFEHRSFQDPQPDLDGKVIMVTGGTGSFGQHFVRRVAARYTPKKLIIFSRDELKQYDMQMAFPPSKYPFMRF
ncbi:MAG: UDP-N-acetylglucosamine 4,6-dehydratase (inverting), partial [Alphaproteobacteria bacterium]|nr:UDP-N-acetylglucosamine 4,6-dehydratase (inverting) [Alphaproteobacteria bacterium]